MKTAYDIIIRPVITEQSMEATDQKKCQGRYPEGRTASY